VATCWAWLDVLGEEEVAGSGGAGVGEEDLAGSEGAGLGEEENGGAAGGEGIAGAEFAERE
jgi:hypothetical protein